MNGKAIVIPLLAMAVSGGQIAFGADSSVDLIKNPGFELNSKGKPFPWNIRSGKIEKMLVGGSRKGTVAVKMPLVPTKSGVFKYGNVLSQGIPDPAPGTYVVSVNLSPSRKFVWTQIVIYYKDPVTGKTVYSSTGRLKEEDYPKAGEWKMKFMEFTIPADVKFLGFAVELRDNEPDGFVLIEKPSFVLREE